MGSNYLYPVTYISQDDCNTAKPTHQREKCHDDFLSTCCYVMLSNFKAFEQISLMSAQ